MSEERLAELEMRTAFQDDTIAALNDVLVSQQKQLDQLRRELRELREHVVLNFSQEHPKGPAEEIPPHY